MKQPAGENSVWHQLHGDGVPRPLQADPVAGLIGPARTAVVNVIVAVERAFLFNRRSFHRPCLSRSFSSNRWWWLGAGVILGAHLLFTYLPLMDRVYHPAPIGAEAWTRIVAVVAGTCVIVEVEKWIRHGRPRGVAAAPE